MELIMRKLFTLLAAGAITLSPSMILAKPGGGGGMGHGASIGQGAAMGHNGSMGLGSTNRMSRASQATTQTSQGSTNGKGWDHQNGPASTGQPGVECEDGIPPGNASSARGSAFNEDGVAHEHYAGEQPQNSRNTASSSQYDTACLRPQH
jgi:hypothetical protein